MEDIYADLHDEIIVLKSSQASLSEWLVNIMFWFVDTNKGNTYFAFPTKSECGVFVQGRVDKAADETPYLLSQLKGKTDNVSMKRFGFRNMYFTGTQKRKNVLSNPADIILEDEYDEHGHDVHDLVEKRLNNSIWKWKRRISTPTVPEFGIHKKWLESDQRCWHVQCPDCKKEIRISGDDFGNRWKNFICDNPTGGKMYCCPECKSIQFNPSSEKGYWKPTYTDRKIHGYSINRTMTKRCSADELWQLYEQALRNDTIDEFYKSDLGCPYQKKGSRLSESDVIKCKQANIYKSINIRQDGKEYYMGVDTGANLHAVVMDNNKRIVTAKSFPKSHDGMVSYMALGCFIEEFQPNLLVIDNRPEPTPVDELRNHYNIVRGAEHNTGIIKPTQISEKEIDRIVYYNRYCSIERLYNYILNATIGIPTDIEELTEKEFARHIISQMRIERINEKNNTRYLDYVSTTGRKQPDHYLSATIYALAAMDAYITILAKHPPRDCGIILL